MTRVIIICTAAISGLLIGCSAAVRPIPGDIEDPTRIGSLVEAYEAGKICQTTVDKRMGRSHPIKRPIYVYSKGPIDAAEFRKWIGEDETTETQSEAATAVFVVQQKFSNIDMGTFESRSSPTRAKATGTVGTFWFCIVQPDMHSVFFQRLVVPAKSHATAPEFSSTVKADMHSPASFVSNLFWEHIGFQDPKDPVYRIVVEFRCAWPTEDGKVKGFFYTKPYWSSVSCEDAVDIFEQESATKDVCASWQPGGKTYSTRIANVYSKSRPNEVPCSW